MQDLTDRGTATPLRNEFRNKTLGPCKDAPVITVWS